MNINESLRYVGFYLGFWLAYWAMVGAIVAFVQWDFSGAWNLGGYSDGSRVAFLIVGWVLLIFVEAKVKGK